MYTITYNGRSIYDPRVEDRIIREPSVTLQVNAAGSMSFILDHDHPELSNLRKLRGIIELQSDGVPIFRGRIIRDTIDFWNSHNLELEGVLACLNDSIVEPYDYPTTVPGATEATNVVEYFLAWVLSNHNAQVTDDQKIFLGTCTVTDPNNYIHRSAEGYSTSFETIKAKLLDPLGGYFLVRYESDGTYLDYYASLPLDNIQEVSFGENLLDLTREQDAAEIYTAILPVGADGLTIEDEPDGTAAPGLIKDGLIIYSTTGRENFGNITRVVDWSDVTLSVNLKQKAIEELASAGLGIPQTITCSAVDLGCIDSDVARFRVGRNTFVVSTPHGISASFPLLEIKLDILEPGSTEITMGRTDVSFSGSVIDDRRAQADAMAQQQMQINQNAGNVTELSQSISSQITTAVQDARSIIFTALQDYVQTGDFRSYQETVSSQLSILNNNITLSIAQVTTEISNVNGDLQKKVSDITKYFRFDSAGLWIGETGNEVLLNLDNDTIQFLRNNSPVMWIDPRGVHVENVEANRVQIGNMELVAESDGRLSFRKAGN